jgi:hypothetical protein
MLSRNALHFISQKKERVQAQNRPMSDNWFIGLVLKSFHFFFIKSSCNICGMLFNKAWNLKAHQNVHRREKGEPLLMIRNKAEKSKISVRKLGKIKKFVNSESDPNEFQIVHID